jgi:uncharacterized protein YbjQ (UPF0145 family)
MPTITGLSGNEIFCLHQKKMQAGDLVIGNSVFSLGLIAGIGSGIKTLLGGEVAQITEIIHDGRQQAYERMVAEAKKHGGIGITGVNSELIQQIGGVEFLSVGSCVHREGVTVDQLHQVDQLEKLEKLEFSSSADGQALYCQLDAGFTPKKFVFGNVAYSIGVGGGILGTLKSLRRGEIKEFSEIFQETRHLSLQRIKKEAQQIGANAVVGIETSIIPFSGMQEMVMIGTASHHPALSDIFNQNPITSDLTNEEMWNLIYMGYMPIELVLGVSVYSLGVVGGITSAFKSLARGEINELTTLIYEARENAISKIKADAKKCGADSVIGIKTYIYKLGSGIIEFMAVGTAVKKMPGLSTLSPTLPPQAIIKDRDTFINTAELSVSVDLNQGNR